MRGQRRWLGGVREGIAPYSTVRCGNAVYGRDRRGAVSSHRRPGGAREWTCWSAAPRCRSCGAAPSCTWRTWSTALARGRHRAELVRLPVAWEKDRLFDAAAGLAAGPGRRRPGDRHQLPVLLRPPPPQGGVAVPPAPRRLRRRRRRLVRLRARRRLPRGAAPARRVGHPGAGRGRAAVHHLGRRGRPAARATTGWPPSRSTTRRRCRPAAPRRRSATTCSAPPGWRPTSAPTCSSTAVAHASAGGPRGGRRPGRARWRRWPPGRAASDRSATGSSCPASSRRRAGRALRRLRWRSSTPRSTRTTATSRCRRSSPASR